MTDKKSYVILSLEKLNKEGDKVAFCYDKLIGRITEICGTRQKFGELMEFSSTTTTAKLNNKSEFSQDEIIKAIEVLKLQSADIPLYFFTRQV